MLRVPGSSVYPGLRGDPLISLEVSQQRYNHQYLSAHPTPLNLHPILFPILPSLPLSFSLSQTRKKRPYSHCFIYIERRSIVLTQYYVHTEAIEASSFCPLFPMDIKYTIDTNIDAWKRANNIFLQFFCISCVYFHCNYRLIT